MFLDFHVMRKVFFVIVRAMRSPLFVLSWFDVVRSPSGQTEGDDGMWQPRERGTDSVFDG